ncbi:uncharacterized protein EAF01_005897 [Botrytis porri]|uniref:uncharacterized protein n=1 Tax=Botrytis porri TaxID=87229 RepID=UPI00190117BD|nr:uncharacterized protein EAF01_005897 [Botrytis porri]KAF7905376.1 hypothetical protein EAF01_005897 [Botrytis porri]
MEAIGTISNIAGILSAGIQVCEGLINYYNAWKGSKKENADMIKSIEGLLTNFALLKAVLQSSALDKTMTMTVESKILDCEDSIAELGDVLKKVMVCKPFVVNGDDLIARKSHDNQGFRDKMTEQGRRILYPFRKSTLMRLQESIEHVRSNLVFAMDILNLSTVSTTAEKVVDISKQVTTISDGVGGKDRLLWCSGSPGAGKTVLTSAIVDDLESRFSVSNVGIAFIYCNYAEKVSIAEYLASIIQQLIRQRFVIPDYILDLYHKHRSMGTNINAAEAVHLLHALTSEFPRLYVVVDALDECEETKKTRTNLIRQLQNLPSNVHLLLTSRRLGDIEEKLSDYPHLNIQASDDDVRAYLEARIDMEENILKFCKKDPTLRKTIVGKIAEKAHGMFLLAHMHIEAIASELKISRVRKALTGLPEILDNTYDDAMKRIMEGQETNRKILAMNILMWLSCAKKPLTVRELQHAVAIMELDSDESELDEDEIYDQDLLLTVCAGLVVVDPESGVIRLYHFTLQEYFERHRAKLFPNSGVLITQACIRYLSLDNFKEPECPNPETIKTRLKEYPLLSYVSQHLGVHAQGAAETELMDDILHFLNQKTLVNGASAAMMPFSIRHMIEFPPPIVAAAMFGLPTIVGELLKGRANIEAVCPKDFTPLLVAAELGHFSVVQLLINSKANLLAKDHQQENSLHKAAWKGHVEIVKQLVSAQPSLIEIPFEEHFNKTALHIAIDGRHEGVIRALIEAGADVNASDELSLTPLMKVVVDNLPDAIDLLISKGAYVDAKGFREHATLSMAATAGNIVAVKKLLAAGAEVDAGKNTYSGTALVRAVSSGHAKVGRDDSVQVLIEAGANLHAKTFEGNTALASAGQLRNRGPHPEVIALLTGAMRSNPLGTVA